MRMIWIGRVVALAVVSVALTALYQPATANAVSGECYFNTNTGPVTGTTGCAVGGLGAYGTNDVFPGRDSSGNGTALPYSVTTKAQFIDWVVDNYNSSNDQKRVGAAFIIQELRGSRAWPDNAARDNWVALMNDDSVRVVSQSGRKLSSSSWYDPDKKNVFYDSYATTRDVVKVQQNGKNLLVIERACGNLVGGGSGIDKPWALSVDSWFGSNKNTKEASARIGQPTHFNHQVTNDGPSNMDDDMDGNVEWSGGNQTGYTSGNLLNCNDANGLAKAETTGNRCDTSFTIPTGAPSNGRYCQRIAAAPRSSSNASEITSNNACVNVIPEWHLGTPTTTRNLPAATEYGAEGGPNQAFSFTHSVTNNGPHHMNSAGNGTSSAWVQEQHNNGVWTNRTAAVAFTRANGGAYTVTNTGTLPADFLYGKRYCQRLVASPRSAIGNDPDNGSVISSPVCVEGRREFTLIPGVSVTPSSAVEAGNTVSAAPVVENQGPTLSRDNTDWYLVTFNMPSGVTVPSAGTGTGLPCDYYDNNCTRLSNGRGTFPYGNPSIPTGVTGDSYTSRGFTIPESAELGSRYCFALSVKPYKWDVASTVWRYGTPRCVTVGIKPRVQVWGHDVKAGGVISSSISSISGRTYAGLGEYGVLSNGENKGMSSGGALLGGYPSLAQGDWSPFTFANRSADASSQFGFYEGVYHPVVPAVGAVEMASPATYSGNIPARTKLVIRVNGQLTIDNDIRYNNGSYSSIRDIPRVVIIADDVIINDNVTQIDSWIVANRISTCDDARQGTNYFVKPSEATLSASMCEKSLRFNGPVVTNEIYLHRTTNSGSDTDKAAEIFNLRADAFLSAFAGGGTPKPVANTNTVKELPPRF